jgi:hypothetical protein
MPYAQLGEDIAPLRDVDHARVEKLPWREIGDLTAIQGDGARTHRKQPEDGFEHRRFAGAIRPDHRGYGTAMDARRGAIENAHFAVTGEDAIENKQRFRGAHRQCPR